MKQTIRSFKYLRIVVYIFVYIFANVAWVCLGINVDAAPIDVVYITETQANTSPKKQTITMTSTETIVPNESLSLSEIAGSRETVIPTEKDNTTETEAFSKISETTIGNFTDHIPVTDIAISDFEDVIEVDKTVTLSTTVIPATATDQVIQYTSSNPLVATVSSAGEIKGISSGQAIITLSCGKIKKTISITVKVSAKLIEVNETYIILSQGEAFQLTATVLPENASDRTVEYESNNSDVATVSKEGLVVANGIGNTIIMVKNKDIVSAITVIVNINETTVGNTEPPSTETQQEEIEKIMSVSDCPIIDSNMLRYLYNNDQQISIEGNAYTLNILGHTIANIYNELKTDINLSSHKETMTFSLNGSNHLCGPVTLRIEDAEQYRYLYLYNHVKEQYVLVKENDLDEITLTTNGQYMMTRCKLSTVSPSWMLVFVAGTVIIVALLVFIAFRKRYWFW